VAQAVEHLLCSCEALSSNTSPTKKRKEKKERINAMRKQPCRLGKNISVNNISSKGYYSRFIKA
jgi:hypothetical protein